MTQQRPIILLAAILLAGQARAQLPESPAASLSPDEAKSMLALAFNRNTFGYLPGPYHVKAVFETFTGDGKPDGEGSIDRYFAAPGHVKIITTFRGHSMSAYFVAGKWQYADDDFRGSIMSYFADSLLLNPLLPEPGFMRRDIQTSTRQQGSDLLDCAAMQFYIVPPGSELPMPPRDVFCISRNTHDLALRISNHFTVSYKDSAPFLDRSIPRLISASQDGVVRIRIRVQQVDQQTLNEADYAPTSTATLVSPAPDILATKSGETQASHAGNPPLFRRRHPTPAKFLVLISREGKVIDCMPEETLPPELSAAAVAWIREWTYAPIIRQGIAVDIIISVYVTL